MPHIITLTGASGCGKSTAVRALLAGERTTFRPVLVPKFTTRPPRGELEPEAICVDAIPATCDLVYEQYEVRYGLEMRQLYDRLRAGLTPIVILNDVRAVEDVRQAFGRLACSLFVIRESPALARYEALARARGAESEDDLYRRYRKAQAIFRVYIENIHIFDHVVLNVGSIEDLEAQIDKVIEGLAAGEPRPLREVLLL